MPVPWFRSGVATRAAAAVVALACVLGIIRGPIALAATDPAQAPKSGNEVLVTKEVTGTVSAISPKDRMLTVIYQQDKAKGVENEILLALAEDVEVRYKRTLSEFKYGDTVRVSYVEKQAAAERQTPDGKTEHFTKVVSREATVIAFLKPQTTGVLTNE